MTRRLKNSKEAATYRADLLAEQKGLDPITKELIQDGVLDHQHFGDQKCRNVLERTTNVFEGKVYNSYLRYVKHLTNKPLPEILRNLADYLEADVSQKPIHHTALTVDTRKFKGLSASDQKELLIKAGLDPDNNSAKRTNQARKLIKNNKLVHTNGKWIVK